jgi:hypothetical protein
VLVIFEIGPHFMPRQAGLDCDPLICASPHTWNDRHTPLCLVIGRDGVIMKFLPQLVLNCNSYPSYLCHPSPPSKKLRLQAWAIIPGSTTVYWAPLCWLWSEPLVPASGSPLCLVIIAPELALHLQRGTLSLSLEDGHILEQETGEGMWVCSVDKLLLGSHYILLLPRLSRSLSVIRLPDFKPHRYPPHVWGNPGTVLVEVDSSTAIMKNIILKVLKKLDDSHQMIQQSWHWSKKMKAPPCRDNCTITFVAGLFTMAKTRKQAKSP